MSNLQRIAQRFSIRNLLFHILAVLFLDMQFLYFLRPTYSIPCFFFAAILWAMTVEDYRTQLIDLRLVASAAVLGVLMRKSCRSRRGRRQSFITSLPIRRSRRIMHRRTCRASALDLSCACSTT